MKKTVILICGLLLTIASCASLAPSAASRLVWTKDYEVLSRTFERLEGTTIFNDMVLYKKTDGLGTVHAMVFGKAVPNKKQIKELKDKGYEYDLMYYFSVHYQGKRWLFIDEFKFKTDEKIIELKDSNPMREVSSLGSDVYNLESAMFFLLSEDDIKSLLNTQSLSIQYTGSPIIKLPEEAIQKIKEFIKSEIITTPSKNW